MKEIWKYEDFRKYGSGFAKVKQVLTWRFYIRPLHEWFTPCEKCQKFLDERLKVNAMIFILETKAEDAYFNFLCMKCKDTVKAKIKDDATLIIGNRDYEPRLELSRQWIDIDETMVDITEEEYKKMR